MTHTPRTIFMLAALASGVLSAPALADDNRPDAVVTGRHYEVPPPRSDYLRLNTAQLVAPEPIVVRPVGGITQVAPVIPVTPRSGGAIPLAAGPTFALDQPGLPAGAREEALRASVMPPSAGTVSAPSAVPLQGIAANGQASVQAAVVAEVAPPRVFQTMKQAASAASVAPAATAIAPVRPDVVDNSWRGRALALMTAYPMVLPGGAMFLVLLAFLFKRFRTNRGGHEANE